MINDDSLYRNTATAPLNIRTTIDSFQMFISIIPNLIQSNKYSRHNHSLYEMHFFLSGEGTLYIDNKKINIVPDSFILISPGVYHSFHPNHDLHRYSMQLTVNELEQAEVSKHQQSHYELQSLFSNMGPYLYLETGIEPMLRIIEEICYESEMELKGADWQIQSLFVQLLVHMMRILSPSLPLCSTLPPPANTIDKDQGDIIDGFFDRYQEPLTINDLSELLYISDKQTNRILNKYYQTSFKQKQLDTRVQVALDLLQSTEMTISEIAEHVGYAPAYNFSKVFKQKMGITPKQYRKEITLYRT